MRPLATKPAKLNMHSTGTEAADADKCSPGAVLRWGRGGGGAQAPKCWPAPPPPNILVPTAKNMCS